MMTDITDYELVLNRIKRDEVEVSVKNVYTTNWKISNPIGKLKTVAWYIAPHLPILFCGFWLIYTGQYWHLLALPVIHFFMLLAHSGVNLISLAHLAILFLISLTIDVLFQTQMILISVSAFLSWVLAVMSLYNIIQNAVDNAVASKELFRELYDKKTLEVYEKIF